MKQVLFPALLSLLLAAGCSTQTTPPPERDHAPATPEDVGAVPDAVPRKAPRSRYGNPPSYTVLGRTYQVLDDATGFRQRGLASWYGMKFHGRRTSSGEPYDLYAMTAAHRTLPLPTWVRVTNLENGRSVVVKVNDRGPFHEGRIIDLSYAAAVKLGVVAKGTAPVEIVALTTPGKEPFSRAAESVPDPAGGTGSYLQAGAFSSITNARSLQRRLQRIQDHPVAIRHEGGLHKVVLGPVTDAQLREQLWNTLEEWGIRPHHLVQ